MVKELGNIIKVHTQNKKENITDHSQFYSIYF